MRRPGRHLAAGLAAAALLTVAGCGDDAAGTADDAGAQPPAATDTASGTPPPEATDATDDVDVPAALDFTTTTVSGETFEGASLAGSPAVLWFWAHDCPICQGEAPAVKAAFEEWGGEVTFVGIPGRGEPAQDQGFVDTYDLGDLTHARDTDGSIWTGFGVVAQPAFAFVGADGDVDVVPGTLSDAELEHRLAELAETDG